MLSAVPFQEALCKKTSIASWKQVGFEAGRKVNRSKVLEDRAAEVFHNENITFPIKSDAGKAALVQDRIFRHVTVTTTSFTFLHHQVVTNQRMLVILQNQCKYLNHERNLLK